MAVVNPGINPTNDPDYTRSSRGADVPDNPKPQGQQQNSIEPTGVRIGDRSAEYQGQAVAYGMQGQAAGMLADSAGNKQVGDIFASIVQGVDYITKTGEAIIKQDIDRKVYDTVNAEREKEIQRLTDIQRGAVSSGSTSKSLLDANASMDTPDVPETVRDSVDSELSILSGLKNSGGRLSKDYYYGRQTDALKELRAQYPGYKEYVDQRFKSVLGTDPANAKITQMVSDINRASSQVNAERNMVIKTLMGSGMPGARGMLQQYLTGQTDASNVYLNVTQHNTNVEALKMFKLEREAIDVATAAREQKAQKEFDWNVNTSVNAAIKGLTFDLGINNPVSLEQFTANLKNWTPVQIQQANDQIEQLKETLKLRFTADSVFPGKNNRTLNDDLGGSKIRDQKIAEGLNYLTELQKGLTNRDTGPAFRLVRQLDAQYQITKAGLRALPGVGTTMDIHKALTESGLDPKIFTLESLDKTVVDQELRPYRDGLVKAMKAQTSLQNIGKPTTGNSMLDNMQENGIKDPAIVDNIIKEAVSMALPGMPEEIKKNLNAAMFSRENRGFLSRLNKDGKDSQGNDIPGQWYTFNMLTNDQIAESMHKLGGNYWLNYKNWTETEFRNLFVSHIKELNSQTYNKGIQVMWDSTNKQFDVFSTSQPRGDLGSRFAGGADPSSGAVIEAKQTINRINAGLESLKTIGVYTGKGDDVDAYLLRTLTSSGWSAAERTKGLPKAMADAIIKANDEEAIAKAKKGVIGDKFNRVNQ